MLLRPISSWRYFLLAALFGGLTANCDTMQQSPGAAAEAGADMARGAELLRNGGFEQGGSPAPQGWVRDMGQTGQKGNVTLDRGRQRSGQSSLKLEPNSRNVGDQPLAIAQIIDGTPYRGRQVEFSGYLAAQNGASAFLGMLSIAGGQARDLVLVSEPGGSTFEWMHHSSVYNVPDAAGVQLVLTTFVNGTAGAAWFDDVSVVPLIPASTSTDAEGTGRRRPAQIPTREAQTLNASIAIDAGKVIREIPKTLYGTNIEWRWNANGLWNERLGRPDPEIIRLSDELGVTLIRYPGGVYSDFYHWKQGIGPLSDRPMVLHQAGSEDRSRPYFGTEEALAFAREVGAELLITVNAGTGTAEEAAAWVKYVNAKDLRVRYWEVGNELYIGGSDPIPKATSIDAKTYAQRYLTFARAMRAADPRIKIGAIGGENQGRYNIVTYPNWNRTLLQTAGKEIDFLSVHNAYYPVVLDAKTEVRDAYQAMFAAPILVRRNLETLSRQIRDWVPDRASEIDIAVTEWGPWFHIDLTRSPYIDHTKTLGSALYSASVLKEFIESPKTGIAAFWMLNDMGTLGMIGSRSTKFPPEPDWTPTARYYALQLFTRHFGDRLIQSTTQSPTFNSPAVGWTEAVKGAPYLDVVCSLSSDGRRLYVIAINKHFDDAITADVSIRGFAAAAGATAWTLTGRGIDAHTGTKIIQIPGLKVAAQKQDPIHKRFSQGGPNEVTFTSSQVEAGREFSYRFPARSATALVLTRQ